MKYGGHICGLLGCRLDAEERRGNCNRLKADTGRGVGQLHWKPVVDVSHEVGGVGLVVPALLGNQSNHRNRYTLLVFIDGIVHGEDFLHLGAGGEGF